ncbi:FG-GAP repeat domain-containing protein [Streptomyces triticisoli]|uniref:FG-GAP repeat domain-containing protein n=1 Tax=Streptomyces triticisoli TaxID=2182797 RepID=UPI000DD5E404|nr:VCBS repeat-containing protein [Streptomyces triticisoli]
MGRHALGRGGLAATVATLAVAVMAASATVLAGGGDPAQAAGAQNAAGTTEITLTDPSSAQPRFDQPFAAGPSGFLHGQSGIAGLLWTSYADGTTVSVRTPDGLFTPTGPCSTFSSTCQQAWYGSDGDLVALPTSTSDTTVTLWDPATRKTSTVTSAYPYRALAGTTVVTSRTLIDTVDGERRERPFTPAEVTVNNGYVMAADAAGVLVRWGTGLYYIDIESAAATKAFSGVSATAPVVLSEGRIGWYGDGGLHFKPRSEPGGEEEFVELPGPYQFAKPVLTGDWLLLPPQTGAGTSTTSLTALSLIDGSSRTLLDKAGKAAVRGPGDTALVTGGTGATDWWVQRVSLTADGTPELTKLYQVPARENAKTGIALSRGSLRVAEHDPEHANGFDTTSVRTLTTNGGTALTASPATESTKILPKCPHPDTPCPTLWGNMVTSPRDVYLEEVAHQDEDDPLPGTDRLVPIGYQPLWFNTTGGSIVDVSDDYVVYDSRGAAPAQYVGRFGYGQLLKRSVRAAALNGPVLWSATTTAGRVTSYSLTEKKTLTTVTVPGARCVPSELQAAGRWLYWACGTTSAGVYDTKAGTSRAVTPGDVLLGDGFTVRHDHGAGTLVLTDAATGATRVLASDVPDTGPAADRRQRWTVDEYTGLVAWFDVHERTHVATTGFTPSAPTAFETDTATQINLTTSTPWTGTWLLSRPVTSWSLTFTSAEIGETGRATRTLTGGAATARVTAKWNGKTAGGVRFPNGRFKWTLKATGLGTSKAVTVGSGSGSLIGGSPVRHDYLGSDGIGDLLTMNSKGSLTIHRGTAKGTLSTKVSGTGWPKGTTVVPFGDLNGDRCNDLVVRPGNGSLRLYKPKCGAALKASTPYTTIGKSGWNQYDVMVSTGDITGDGRPDLITRKASTGDMYLHKGTSTGKLSARVKIASNWKKYKKIVAVGDITGDGIGDLLAQDKSNNLYRYNGTRTGTFKARVRIATKWGGSYNAVVGVGDLNRDGIGDLISRDTSGRLFRNYGNGKGGIGARTQIGTGWGGYKALY